TLLTTAAEARDRAVPGTDARIEVVGVQQRDVYPATVVELLHQRLHRGLRLSLHLLIQPGSKNGGQLRLHARWHRAPMLQQRRSDRHMVKGYVGMTREAHRNLEGETCVACEETRRRQALVQPLDDVLGTRQLIYQMADDLTQDDVADDARHT